MKIILTEEVVNLGNCGDIVDVAPGYARNFLVPRKLAIYANKGNVREMEHHKGLLERKQKKLQNAAMSVAEKINNQVLTIKVKVGENGKLFGSVTTQDIADMLKAMFEIEVDRRKITLGEHISTLGDHNADVRLMSETRANVIVRVVDEAAAE
jgi:large subunit ribosomal protein L9